MPHSKKTLLTPLSQPFEEAIAIQQDANTQGFKWPNVEMVQDKVSEELEEVKEAMTQGDPDHLAEEIGDLLFATISLALESGISPEEALSCANQKFIVRFKYIKQCSDKEEISIEGAHIKTLERWWRAAKQNSQ